jgi:hypothetical protein
MSLYAYCNGDPVNGLDPNGRCSNNSPSLAPIPAILNPDWITRFEYPNAVQSALSNGLPQVGNLSPAQVAFDEQPNWGEKTIYAQSDGESGRSWYPASDLITGATQPPDGTPFKGTLLYIDLNQAGKVADLSDIVANAQQIGIPQSRIGAYTLNQPFEAERLVADVASTGIMTSSGYVANSLGQAGLAIGIPLTLGRMINASELSYQTGDPSYVANQGVHEASVWGGAWVGARGGAALAAEFGIETGPAYPWVVLGGSIVGGFGGAIVSSGVHIDFRPTQPVSPLDMMGDYAGPPHPLGPVRGLPWTYQKR